MTYFNADYGFLKKKWTKDNFMRPDLKESPFLYNYSYVVIYKVNWIKLVKKRDFFLLRSHRIVHCSLLCQKSVIGFKNDLLVFKLGLTKLSSGQYPI